MSNRSRPIVAAALLLVVTSAGCGSAPRAPVSPGAGPDPAAQPALPPGQYPYTAADIDFMSGMIPHHAQAVKIATWAATRTTTPSLRVLAERIVVAQRDEIELMQMWLRDRKQQVPAADATHHRMVHDGVAHDMLMPGMLSDEELAQLERSRGTDFDRLFLTFMIRHHDGAIVMVDRLFGAEGAGQDEIVFQFASDVYADQTAEIDRMEKMLAALPASGR